jgi:hypothetical protein
MALVRRLPQHTTLVISPLLFGTLLNKQLLRGLQTIPQVNQQRLVTTRRVVLQQHTVLISPRLPRGALATLLAKRRRPHIILVILPLRFGTLVSKLPQLGARVTLLVSPQRLRTILVIAQPLLIIQINPLLQLGVLATARNMKLPQLIVRLI